MAQTLDDATFPSHQKKRSVMWNFLAHIIDKSKPNQKIINQDREQFNVFFLAPHDDYFNSSRWLPRSSLHVLERRVIKLQIRNTGARTSQSEQLVIPQSAHTANRSKRMAQITLLCSCVLSYLLSIRGNKHIIRLLPDDEETKRFWWAHWLVLCRGVVPQYQNGSSDDWLFVNDIAIFLHLSTIVLPVQWRGWKTSMPETIRMLPLRQKSTYSSPTKFARGQTGKFHSSGVSIASSSTHAAKCLLRSRCPRLFSQRLLDSDLHARFPKRCLFRIVTGSPPLNRYSFIVCYETSLRAPINQSNHFVTCMSELLCFRVCKLA